MNSNNDRLHHHNDPKTGKQYVSTKDASGLHTLVVDIENAYLLTDASWWVAPIRKGSSKLVARACSKAPRIAKGALLHRKAMRNLPSHRRVRALNGSLLDARRTNLQVVSRSDAVILGKTRRPDKLIGVRFTPQLPRWLKSPCHYHARIKIGGKYLHLGSFKTAEEAAAEASQEGCARGQE